MVATWLRRALLGPGESETAERDGRPPSAVAALVPGQPVNDIFRSGAYLDEYYASLGHENAEVGEFLLAAAKSHQGAATGPLKVLDAGCGPTILYWAAFLPQQSEVHGFDINPVNIAENKRRMAEVQCGVADDGLLEAAQHAIGCMGVRTSARFHLADKARKITSLQVADLTRRWPYEDGMFDFVLSCFALEQLADWSAFDAALREAARVLRPGGGFALVNGSQGTHWLCDKQRFATLFVKPGDLPPRFEQVGFRICAMREIDSSDTNWRDQGYNKVLLTQAIK